jgi:rhodanese-related sulfurtransferase
MAPNDHADIRDLEQALDAVEQDAREPPVKPRFKMKAPKKIVPRASPALSDAAAQFLASQDDVRAFLKTYADVDLAGVRFTNPFIRGVRFSLATGLHVIAAHERRHLWQAWNVRRAEERVRGQRTEGPS